MDHFSMLIPIVQVSYFMLACYSFDGLINLTFLFSIPMCEYLCSIIKNLLGANDPRRPPSQAKMRTQPQFGTIYLFDKVRCTIANESTCGMNHPMSLVS